MNKPWKSIPALLCSLTLAVAQSDTTSASDAANRFGLSLRLPASTFDPAPQSPLAGDLAARCHSPEVLSERAGRNA